MPTYLIGIRKHPIAKSPGPSMKQMKRTNGGIVSQGKDYEADGGRQISQQLDCQHRSLLVSV